MRRAWNLLLFALVVLLWVPIACNGETTTEDDEGGGGAGGIDDGKLHPAPNGVLISETDACERMRNAFDAKIQMLGCTKTVRPCPNFVRAKYDPDCAQYDEGAVQGCIDHWNGIFNGCDFLNEDDCVVVHYPETAPAGCP